MTDEAFRNELWIYCYKHQIDGYSLGHPKRTNFDPIVTTISGDNGKLSRSSTLDLPSYCGFTNHEREILLNEDPMGRRP